MVMPSVHQVAVSLLEGTAMKTIFWTVPIVFLKYFFLRDFGPKWAFSYLKTFWSVWFKCHFLGYSLTFNPPDDNPSWDEILRRVEANRSFRGGVGNHGKVGK